MSKLFTSADVFANSLEFIDKAAANWLENAKEPIYRFPDADITIVQKGADVYLMSKRETFRKKIAFFPTEIDLEEPLSGPSQDSGAVLLQKGDFEIDFVNALLAATTK